MHEGPKLIWYCNTLFVLVVKTIHLCSFQVLNHSLVLGNELIQGANAVLKSIVETSMRLHDFPLIKNILTSKIDKTG